MTPLVPSLQALDSLNGIDSLCLWVRTDERPMRGLANFVDWRMYGYLSRLLQEAYFRGEAEESLLLAAGESLPCKRIFVLGLGEAREWQPEVIERHMEKTQRKLRLAGVSSLAMATPETVPEELWQKACEQHFAWASTFLLFRPVQVAKAAEPLAGGAAGKR
ncbi:MAG: peptidase M17 [Proteobacteria bacterium]|nr:peptidase M17 [Cystobacterineae bacterium]MCL2314544.1 peptidase M17 [Pseudomonadota bacterium]